jgi:tRNA nucleotidyltransferase/poly(A) polymerase
MTSQRRLVDASWLTAGPAARVLALLNGDGEEARAVGGAVRNALMGREVGEIDIATTAVPDEVVRRAKIAGIKSVPTGIEHGTVTLIVDGTPIEVTTLREDVETFGRKAKVMFGRDWQRDATRRDFTMNGLSASIDGVVHDHVDGLPDVDARRVRFIGDPDRRIAEDYLRILRFFRIHAAYGIGAPDRDGYLAAIRGRDGLAGLSAERIRMELLKLLVAPGAEAAVEAMVDAGVMLRICGGVSYLGPMRRMIGIERDLGVTPNAMLRLGALGVAVTEDAKRLTQRLRLTNDENKTLDSMGHRWWRLKGMDDARARQRLYRLGSQRYRNRVLLAWARDGGAGDAGEWRQLLTLPERWTPPVFPLKAADFIVRGIAKGPALGQVLALAEDAWMANDFPMEVDVITVIADQITARFRHDHRL